MISFYNLALIIKFEPYSSKSLNRLNSFNELGILIITSLFGFFMPNLKFTENTKQLISYIILLVFIMLIFSNLLLIIY